MARCPHASLRTSGEDVGLPDGQFGNSEVGHTNIGAGRIVFQDLLRIGRAIERDELQNNPSLQDLVTRLAKSGGTCHIIGLVSDGGVHGHRDHVAALARVISRAGTPVKIHAILDGRDGPPISARADMQAFLADIAPMTGVDIATIAGRYYAFDRDRRWDRIARYYDTLLATNAKRASAPLAAIDDSYALSITDEFVMPTRIGDYDGMRDGDGLLISNFRADRARQLALALLDPDFKDFVRPRRVDFAVAVGMSEYSRHLNRFMNTIFLPLTLNNTLGDVISGHGIKQLRIAETEKYAHVTYFLNGGQDIQFDGEDRCLVPSPRVQTYDMQPEMSAMKMTEQLLKAIAGKDYGFIAVNYANPDMVGHTGVLSAAIKAVETVDSCLGRLCQAVVASGSQLLVIADHGNVEVMYDEATGQPHTSHTLNPVPSILVNGPPGVALRQGRLADIAPTILALMNIECPNAMTGESLLHSGVAP